jgi:hypothetical protein
VLAGSASVAIGPDALEQVGEVEWVADVDGPSPMALFMQIGDGPVGWTSFMVAPDGWSPEPGLVGRSRFEVTLERPGALRRRWTGEAVSDLKAVPPDHYLLDGVPVDVFDDVVVRADGRVETPALPW